MTAPGTPTIVNFFDEVLETYEKENNVLDLVSFYEPDAADMQNGGNVITRPVDQQRPVISGWDLSAEDNEIIQEAYFAYLGTPVGDLIKERADYMRDPKYLMDAARVSAQKQAAYLNSQIMSSVSTVGSLFIRSAATSGYDFIAEGKALMDERGLPMDSRIFVLNNRDSLRFGKDLAARQNLQGRPEKVWADGQIFQNIAGFDIYESPHCPNLVGGVDPATTVTGNQSFAPLPGTVVTTAPTNIVTNNDYRYANIVCAATGNYNVGDKVSIANAAVTVKALNILNKNSTNQAMTFSIVQKIDATHALVTPKPIALDDAGLTTVEAGYSNIDTQILNAATINRLNIDASKQTNLFWQKKAIEVIGGSLPEARMKEFAGWKMMSTTMKNGLKMYMFYDGDLGTLQFRFRLLTWYGLNVAMPAACGVAVTV
jgi:hypothetical protein